MKIKYDKKNILHKKKGKKIQDIKRKKDHFQTLLLKYLARNFLPQNTIIQNINGHKHILKRIKNNILQKETLIWIKSLYSLKRKEFPGLVLIMLQSQNNNLKKSSKIMRNVLKCLILEMCLFLKRNFFLFSIRDQVIIIHMTIMLKNDHNQLGIIQNIFNRKIY